MDSFIQQNAYKNELMDVRKAIHYFLQRKSNLMFSDTDKALQDLDNIEAEIKNIQCFLNNYRIKRMRVKGFSKKERRGLNGAYASSLGRRGQLLGLMREEQLQLQNQLSLLQKSIPDLRRIIVNAMNSPVKVSGGILNQASSTKKQMEPYKKIQEVVPNTGNPTIGPVSHPAGPDLSFVAATLATFLYMFIMRNEKKSPG